MRFVIVVVAVLAGCGGDLLNNELLHAHVDDVVAHDPTAAQPMSQLGTSAALIVPIYGTYRLDQRVFGGVRPSAIVFDWILGGLVPAVLVASSFALHGSGQATARWTALGFYAGTRAGVIAIGNLHVLEYNDYLAHRKP